MCILFYSVPHLFHTVFIKSQLAVTTESSKEHTQLPTWSSALRSARKKLNNLEHESEECPSPSKSGRTHGITGDMSRLQMQEVSGSATNMTGVFQWVSLT